MAPLRLHDRTPKDRAFDAEGSLLLYDPSEVTDEVFDEVFGLRTVAPAALGWMSGHGDTVLPIVAGPQHWRAHGRAETAAQVGRIVRLGRGCSLAMLPFRVASNGADIRFRSAPPSPDEKRAHLAHRRQHVRSPTSEPRRAWIVACGPRLAVTWDFMLGFKAARKRKLFRAGHKAEFAWPAGAHQVGGWTSPAVETDEGARIGQYVLRMGPWTTGREPE